MNTEITLKINTLKDECYVKKNAEIIFESSQNSPQSIQPIWGILNKARNTRL